MSENHSVFVQDSWLLSMFHLLSFKRSDFVEAWADLNTSERDHQGGGRGWEAIRGVKLTLTHHISSLSPIA